ncbi:DUF2750 domain-containing protein [Salinimonas marina]|uniref:DUF2750 domain-containing protein n=1 Tax=Salinimonas marina TaxID=2785918 RepID=A0A7S9HCJ7_9ALTE|nr:DUF2750 domain-containing protein [Salinimonas marina]QPG04531.1 DUF2750 domain-containing protein [Salinimonas marina]
MFPETVTPTLPESVVEQAGKLSAEERLELLLQYTLKAEEVWTLAGDSGFVMLESDPAEAAADNETEQHGNALLPIWPHRDLIGLWTRAQETGATPTPIKLEEFMQSWLPGLASNQVDLVVFPVGAEQTGMVLSAEELQQSLNEG